jgi:integrase
VRLHDLRHSYASTAAGLGASLPVIGALLGHTVPQTTARYAGVATDPRREAAERIGERLASLMSAKTEAAQVVPLRVRRRQGPRRG